MAITKERNFEEVFKSIMEVAPKELAKKLEASVGFWAPEIRWEMLEIYINGYVRTSAIDETTAVALYARLCDCSESEIKARF